MIPPGATWYRGIDLIAVERAMSRRGACPALTEEERRYTERAMTAAEWSAQEIGDRLGVSDRTVTRWREEAEGAP